MSPRKIQAITQNLCGYRSLAESEIFRYDPARDDENCMDSELASIHISTWENNEEDVAQFQAADINNIACAYLWQKEPNLQEAYDLFIYASEKSIGSNPTIEANKVKLAQEIIDRLQANNEIIVQKTRVPVVPVIKNKPGERIKPIVVRPRIKPIVPVQRAWRKTPTHGIPVIISVLKINISDLPGASDRRIIRRRRITGLRSYKK